MDFELLHKHLSSLMQWETVNIPSYDFSTHTRKKESAQMDGHPLKKNLSQFFNED
jgi:uridine kinase